MFPSDYRRLKHLRLKRRRICKLLTFALIIGIGCYSVFKRPSSFGPALEDVYHVEPNTDAPRVESGVDALAELPNLPAAYSDPSFVRWQYRLSDTCAPYPDVFQLAFNNLYWQTLYSSEGAWYLYGAYYENRPLSEVRPAVRLLAMVDRYAPTITVHCQMWFPRQRTPVLVPVVEIDYLWRREWPVKTDEGILHPYLVTCPVPETHSSLVPDSVSLVEHVCDTATNHLRVIYNARPMKKDFVVCVKALNFVSFDYSVRLVEWIELVLLLGADKIVMHYLFNHENVTNVLRYYEREGKVELVPYSLAGDQPNSPMLRKVYLGHGTFQKRFSEMISLNDCAYKNMYDYEYLVIIDVDEVLMPVQLFDWRELVTAVRQQIPQTSPVQSLYAFNVYFHDDDTHPTDRYPDIPSYLHMLQHVLRTTKFDAVGKNAKGFHRTSAFKAVHNHMPVLCLGAPCRGYSMSERDVQLQHYCEATLKNSCSQLGPSTSTVDTTIWRYKRQLIERAVSALSELGFLARRQR